jgi:hypothetical protein
MPIQSQQLIKTARPLCPASRIAKRYTNSKLFLNKPKYVRRAEETLELRDIDPQSQIRAANYQLKKGILFPVLAPL